MLPSVWVSPNLSLYLFHPTLLFTRRSNGVWRCILPDGRTVRPVTTRTRPTSALLQQPFGQPLVSFTDFTLTFFFSYFRMFFLLRSDILVDTTAWMAFLRQLMRNDIRDLVFQWVPYQLERMIVRWESSVYICNRVGHSVVCRLLPSFFYRLKRKSSIYSFLHLQSYTHRDPAGREAGEKEEV